MCSLLALACLPDATSADTTTTQTASIKQRKISLLRSLERLELDAGVYSPAAIASLVELGNIYVDEDDCPEALFMLRRAANLTRINYGLFNADQTEMGELSKECDLKLRLTQDFEREQRYSVLVSEHVYGRDDPATLPTLKRVAQWYEQAGWYLSARQLYLRAAGIVRHAGGEMDLRLVDPLRGIARTRRLAAQRGLLGDDIVLTSGHAALDNPLWRKSATELDRLGRESLEQAARILRAQHDAQRGDLVDTLVELGDWYQTDQNGHHALDSYREAWRESATASSSQKLFSEPVPVAYRLEDIGVSLHRPPAKTDRYEPYRMTFEFTVDRHGAVRDLAIVEADVSQTYREKMTEAFRLTRFRPRFVEGEPVDTQHVTSEQSWYVKTWARRIADRRRDG